MHLLSCLSSLRQIRLLFPSPCSASLISLFNLTWINYSIYLSLSFCFVSFLSSSPSSLESDESFSSAELTSSKMFLCSSPTIVHKFLKKIIQYLALESQLSKIQLNRITFTRLTYVVSHFPLSQLIITSNILCTFTNIFYFLLYQRLPFLHRLLIIFLEEFNKLLSKLMILITSIVIVLTKPLLEVQRLQLMVLQDNSCYLLQKLNALVEILQTQCTVYCLLNFDLFLDIRPSWFLFKHSNNVINIFFKVAQESELLGLLAPKDLRSEDHLIKLCPVGSHEEKNPNNCAENTSKISKNIQQSHILSLSFGRLLVCREDKAQCIDISDPFNQIFIHFQDGYLRLLFLQRPNSLICYDHMPNKTDNIRFALIVVRKPKGIDLSDGSYRGGNIVGVRDAVHNQELYLIF